MQATELDERVLQDRQMHVNPSVGTKEFSAGFNTPETIPFILSAAVPLEDPGSMSTSTAVYPLSANIAAQSVAHVEKLESP